jgi:hypothetical protein
MRAVTDPGFRICWFLPTTSTCTPTLLTAVGPALRAVTLHVELLFWSHEQAMSTDRLTDGSVHTA